MALERPQVRPFEFWPNPRSYHTRKTYFQSYPHRGAAVLAKPKEEKKMEEIPTQFNKDDDEGPLRLGLKLASKSPPKPTNFRVGAVLVEMETGKVTSTGYTLELEGNTHAEQCAFAKLAARLGVDEGEGLSRAMAGKPHAIYTTMEPCILRLSGNKPCVDRILEQKNWVRKVVIGVVEPGDFVEGNDGRQKLVLGGLEVLHYEGLESEILSIARAGHDGAVENQGS